MGSTVKMVFTIKIVILASLTSATEKESGYYVTVENSECASIWLELNDTNAEIDGVQYSSYYPLPIGDGLQAVGSWVGTPYTRGEMDFLAYETANDDGLDWWDTDYSYGCQKEIYTNISSNHYNDKFVVVQRGVCSDMQKVLLAHEQGAIGVVVVNNRVSVGSVVKMNLGELTHRDIKMHVMSVSMRKALIIWEEYIEAKSRNEALFLRSGGELFNLSFVLLLISVLIQ